MGKEGKGDNNTTDQNFLRKGSSNKTCSFDTLVIIIYLKMLNPMVDGPGLPGNAAEERQQQQQQQTVKCQLWGLPHNICKVHHGHRQSGKTNCAIDRQVQLSIINLIICSSLCQLV